ncbi:MAG: hypothetical protein FJ026_14240 [Chloroflexi bacterium]|nr:hypothetical protein [Chloroflexota bacterium]
MLVSAQVSPYPLGQSDLSPAIQAVWKAFANHKLVYQSGSMSTVLEGEAATVFAALRDAFQAAAEYGGTVMAITVSNACPPLAAERSEAHHA